MCMLIIKPQGKTVSEEYLSNSFESNPDCAGYAFVTGGKVHVHKNFKKFEAFMDDYKKRVDPSMLSMIHFRWATHGDHSFENCHPFTVGEGIVMAHNGIISGLKMEKGESDTRAFARLIVQPDLAIAPSLIDMQAWHKKLCGLIGYSKLGFITDKEKYYIDGENLGVWEDGVWFSNDGYKRGPADYIYQRSFRDSDWLTPERKDTRKSRRYEEEDYTEYAGIEPGAMQAYELGMTEPEVMDVNSLECNYCGGHIKGRFTIDREQGVFACSQCCSVESYTKVWSVK